MAPFLGGFETTEARSDSERAFAHEHKIMASEVLPPDSIDLQTDLHNQISYDARVEITRSMLHSYVLMRGAKYDSNTPDPLQSALYPIRSRRFPQDRIELPYISDFAQMGQLFSVQDPRLPVGTRYFWDPLVARELSFASQPLRPIYPLTSSKDSGYDSFDSIPRESYNGGGSIPSLSTLAPNHSKGEKVWENFGYVFFKNRWVDPESEGELNAAWKGEVDDKFYTATSAIIGRERCAGPKIMSREEQKSFYKWYIEEVSSDKDSEGDPRNLRITPQTFLSWAQGAIRGEHYEHHPLKPQKPMPREYFDTEGIIPPKMRIKPQIGEHGSLMTGEYNVDDNPRPLKNPLGFDMSRRAQAFSRMHPRAAVDFDRERFISSRNASSATSGTASTAETFNTVGAAQFFAPEDPVAGAEEVQRRWNQWNEKMAVQEWTINNKIVKRNELFVERHWLDRQVNELEAKLEKFKGFEFFKNDDDIDEHLDMELHPLDLLPPIRAESYLAPPSGLSAAQIGLGKVSKLKEEFENLSSSSGSSTLKAVPDLSHNSNIQPAAPKRFEDSPLFHLGLRTSNAKKSTRQYRRYYRELVELEEIVEGQTQDAYDELTGEIQEIQADIDLLRHFKAELESQLEAVEKNDHEERYFTDTDLYRQVNQSEQYDIFDSADFQD